MQDPKNRHLGTIAQLCRAMSSQLRHVSTIGKNLLNSNVSCTCPHDMVNFDLLAAEILWRVWGTPANFNGFRVLVALLHGTIVVGVSQTLRRWTEGATYIRQGIHHGEHWPIFLVLLWTTVAITVAVINVQTIKCHLNFKLQHNSQTAGDTVDCAAGYSHRQTTASGSWLNSKLSPTQRAKLLRIQLTVLIIAVKFNKSRFPRLLMDLNCSAILYFKGSQPASSELKIKCCE